MRRTVIAAAALSIASLALAGAAVASPTPPTPTPVPPPIPPTVVEGVLGIAGGPFPGHFHPISGTVEIDERTIAVLVHVGRSGQFRIPVEAGTVTVTGCLSNAQICSLPVKVFMHPGQVRFVKLEIPVP